MIGVARRALAGPDEVEFVVTSYADRRRGGCPSARDSTLAPLTDRSGPPSAQVQGGIQIVTVQTPASIGRAARTRATAPCSMRVQARPSRPIAVAEPEGQPHGRQLLAESRPRYERVYAPGVVGVVAGSTAVALPPLVLGRR